MDGTDMHCIPAIGIDFNKSNISNPTQIDEWNYFYSFSLATEKMKKIARMDYGCFNYSAAIMNGNIYVAGGQTGPNTYLQNLVCYNPAENTWINKAPMSFSRANFALIEWNENLYAMGHHKSIERYDPFQNEWTVVKIRSFNYISVCVLNYSTLNILLQVGSFDKCETIKRAIIMRDEIFVWMINGEFAKLKTEPQFSLLPLRSVHDLDSGLIVIDLFIN